MATITVLADRAEICDITEINEPAPSLASAVMLATARRRRSRPVRMIAGASPSAAGWALTVTSYGGDVETLELHDSVDWRGASEQLPVGCRPLAVRVDLAADGPHCTCLVRSTAGPHRVRLSVRAALSLVIGGVHGIVAAA